MDQPRETSHIEMEEDDIYEIFIMQLTDDIHEVDSEAVTTLQELVQWEEEDEEVEWLVDFKD